MRNKLKSVYDWILLAQSLRCLLWLRLCWPDSPIHVTVQIWIHPLETQYADLSSFKLDGVRVELKRRKAPRQNSASRKTEGLKRNGRSAAIRRNAIFGINESNTQFKILKIAISTSLKFNRTMSQNERSATMHWSTPNARFAIRHSSTQIGRFGNASVLHFGCISFVWFHQ